MQNSTKTRNSTRRRPERNRGLTLIELMVALAIGSFLMIGAITVFMQSQTSFRINESVARMQENARFVFDAIEPDVRMAHYFGLTTHSQKIQGRASESEPPAFAVGGDCGVNWAVDLADEVEASNNAYTWTCAPYGTAEAAADTLVIRRAAEAPVPVAPGPQQNTLYIQSARFQDGRLFVGPTVPSGFLPATSATHELVVNGYYVSENSTLDTPGNSVPSLRRKTLVGGAGGLRIVDQEVLPGVDDMQIQLGVDTDPVGAANRGAIDRYVDPDDPILNPSSPGFIATAEVLSVRLWIRIRAERAEPGFTDTTNYVYADQNLAAPGDGFRRLVLSKTIYLRNARPAS